MINQIEEITDTSNLKDVYFEDIDDLVGNREKAFKVAKFKIYYYSTREHAENSVSMYIK